MDIATLVYYFVIYFVIIIPSSIIHEYMHGWMAERLGDKTARYAGRLTLDPRVHIDLWGTLLMPLALFVLTSGRFMFAYAKPVPYNPYNLKDQKWGPVWVGLAGPLSNLLLAAAFALVLRFMPFSAMSEFLYLIVRINVVLLVFNLVPIPPLDGSKLLYALLPDSANNIKMFFDRYGFVVLMFFIFYGFKLIQPIIDLVVGLLVGFYL